VELATQPSAAPADGIAFAAGFVRLETLRWTSSEIELCACPDGLAALAEWVLPSARAHGTSTPTLRAVPTLVSAVGDDPVVMGEMAPPAGRYCSVHYRLAPADRDAVGLAGVPAMLGMSLVLHGTSGSEGAALSEFGLASRRVLDLELPIELELSAERRSARLRFGCDLERWFADIGADALAHGASEQAILDAFRDAFAVSLE
jgi:hypothetical protein